MSAARRRRVLAALLLPLAFLLTAPDAHAARATIAVAANFAEPMEILAPLFEDTSGHELELVVGSTGKLYAQITHGAPFDVLLAANDERPRRLAAEGLADPTSLFTYALGRLVLWSPDPRRIEDGPAALRAGGFRFLALANPALASYGAGNAREARPVGGVREKKSGARASARPSPWSQAAMPNLASLPSPSSSCSRSTS